MRQDAESNAGVGPRKITELMDMYTQLNRIVDNLANRMAEQERRLNRKVPPFETPHRKNHSTVEDHYGKLIRPSKHALSAYGE